MAEYDKRELLISMLRSLNDDELDVVLQVVDGLIRGKREYGDLRISDDRREWTKEATEEIRDALVYVSIQMVRLGRE